MATKTLKVVISGDPKGAQKAFGDVEKSGSKLGNALGGVASKIATAFKGIAIGVGAALTAVLAKAVHGGWQRLAALESADKMLTQLGLSADQTESLMSSLDTTVTGTAFGLDEGATAMTRLVAAGMDLDKVPGALDSIADAAAFGGAELGEVADIFARIEGAGRVTGRELQMLVDRNVPAFAVLASGIGVTEEEVRKMASAGQISAEMFGEAWAIGAQGFGDDMLVIEGAAQSMGDTTAGAFGLMNSALDRLGAALIGPLYAAAPAIFLGIRDAVQSVTDVIKPMTDSLVESGEAVSAGERIGDVFRRVGEAVAILVERVIDMDWGPTLTTLRDLGQSAWNVIDDLLTRIETGEGGDTFGAITDSLGPLFSVMVAIREPLMEVVSVLLPALTDVAKAAAPVIGSLGASVGKVLVVALEALVPILDILDRNGLLTPLIGGLMALVAVVKIITIAKTAWAAASAAAAAATLLLSSPIAAIVVVVGLLVAAFIWAYQNVDWFRAAVDAFAAAAVAAFQWVWEKVQAVFSWVSENWPLLLAILTGPIGLAVLAITTHWDTISNAFTAVKDWIGQKVGEIVGFITGIPGRITGVVSTMWNGLTSGITTATDWVRQKVDAIAGFFSGLPGRISGVFSGLANTISGPFKSGAEAIRSAWNSTIGGKGVSIPNIPGLPGRGERFEIPRLHTGGIFRAPTAGGEGWAVLRDGERVLTPNQMGPSSRGGVTYVDQGMTVQVTVHGSVLSERDLVDVVRDGLLRKQATSGRPILPGVA